MSPIPEKDARVLRYAGALGHTFVVVVDSLSKESENEAWVPDGGRRTLLETCNRQDAIKTSWAEERLNASVYQQVKRGKWKKIR